MTIGLNNASIAQSIMPKLPLRGYLAKPQTQAAQLDETKQSEIEKQAAAYTGVLFAQMLTMCFGQNNEEGFLGGGTGADMYQSFFMDKVGDAMANSPLGQELTQANIRSLSLPPQTAPQQAAQHYARIQKMEG